MIQRSFSTRNDPPKPETDTLKTPERDQGAETPEGIVGKAVQKLNRALASYPQESIVTLFGFDIGSVFLTYGLLQVSGLQFSPEFAIAFAASRPLRKVRLPLDVATSAALAKLCPALTHVELSILAKTFLPQANQDESKKGGVSGMLNKGMNEMNKVVDKYGAAYLIGSRVTGVAVVSALYIAIQQGVDLMPILEKFGVDELGTALGSWAAAVVFSSSVYPLTLGATGYVVPLVAQLRKTLSP